MKNNTVKKIKAAGAVRAVYVPKTYKNDDSLYVSVNGKAILVKKGETVELPECFAEVVENSLAAAGEAERFIEAQAHFE